MTSTIVAASSNLYNTLFSVTGKNVLITGGSRGIGLMIAQGYVIAGANVILTSRDENACRDAIQQIQQSQHYDPYPNYFPPQYVTSSLATREGCEELAKKVQQIFPNGKIDILINNAGTSWGEPLERNSKTNWGFDRVFDLNVKGMFYLTRACIPLMRRDTINNTTTKEEEEGNETTITTNSEKATTTSTKNDTIIDPARIINIGSVTGIVPQEAPTYAYDISKAAVHQLTRKLSKDLSKFHITVNCIAPGFIPTRMSSGLASYGGTPDVLSKHIPLQRMGNADDMVGACIYLSSKAGSWCTGVILNVDGGTIGAMQIPLSSL